MATVELALVHTGCTCVFFRATKV